MLELPLTRDIGIREFKIIKKLMIGGVSMEDKKSMPPTKQQMDEIVDICEGMRVEIGKLGSDVKMLINPKGTHLAYGRHLPEEVDNDTNEMFANTMLAFRHLEDARMRLGKVIQAYQGGVSCYDSKPEAVDSVPDEEIEPTPQQA